MKLIKLFKNFIGGQFGILSRIFPYNPAVDLPNFKRCKVFNNGYFVSRSKVWKEIEQVDPYDKALTVAFLVGNKK